MPCVCGSDLHIDQAVFQMPFAGVSGAVSTASRWQMEITLSLVRAGAVNMNLQNLRQRVDKALTDMRLICDNLNTAMRRVRRHQLDLRSFEKALQADKDAPGAPTSMGCRTRARKVQVM
jgi:hypothetical protein